MIEKEEFSLANVANLIQTNIQAIYYIFYHLLSARGTLWSAPKNPPTWFRPWHKRRLFSTQTGPTQVARFHSLLLNCSPTIRLISGQHPKGKDKSKLIGHQGKLCTSMHIPFHTFSSFHFMSNFYATLFRSSIVFGFRWHTRLSQPRSHLLNWHGIRHLAALERWDPWAFPKIGGFPPPQKKIIHFLLGFPLYSIYKPSILGYLYFWKHHII